MHLSQDRFETMSHVSDRDEYRAPPGRYYTIGGHGKASSVTGVPRYERRYVQNGSMQNLIHEPHYVQDVITPRYEYVQTSQGPRRVLLDDMGYERSGSVIGAPRYDGPMRMHGSASAIGIPRYEGPMRHAHLEQQRAARYDPTLKRFANGYANPSFSHSNQRQNEGSVRRVYVDQDVNPVSAPKAASVIGAPR